MTPALITNLLTPEDYLALEIEADTRHEYRNGEMIAMTGGTPAHNEIALIFSALLWLNLRGQNYRVFGADQRLWVPEHNLYTYPDVMLLARPLQLQPGRKDTVTNPLLIAEVLSQSTKDYDRGDKFLAYRTLPTLQEYLLIDQYQPRVEQYVKQSAHQWLLTEHYGQDTVLSLASVPVSIPLTDLYSNLEED